MEIFFDRLKNYCKDHERISQVAFFSDYILLLIHIRKDVIPIKKNKVGSTAIWKHKVNGKVKGAYVQGKIMHSRTGGG